MARKKRGLLSRLFRTIIWTVVIILAIPAILLFLLYHNVSVPKTDYEQAPTMPTSIAEMIEYEVDEFLNDSEQPLKIGLSKAVINKTIKNEVIKALDTVPDNDDYVLLEENFGIQGAWIEMIDNGFRLVAGAHGFLGSMTYRTSVRLGFTIDDESESGHIIFTLSEIKVGKLSLGWATGFADWILSKVYQGGINALVNDALGGIGDFNLKEKRLSIDIQKAFDLVSSDATTKKALDFLYEIIFEKELIDLISFEDNEVKTTAFLNRIVDNVYVTIPVIDQIQTDEELKAVLAEKALNNSTELFLSLLNNQAYVDLDDYTFNRMLEYFVRKAMNQTSPLYHQNIYGDYYVDVLMPYAVVDETLSVRIPIQLYKQGEGVFTTQVTIKTGIDLVGDDLVLTIQDMYLGEIAEDISLGQEQIEMIFGLIADDSGMFTDSSIVIADFKSQLGSTQIEIEDIEVIADQVRVTVTLTGISGIQTEISAGLQAIALTYPELNSAIQAVLTGPIDETAIDALLEEIDGLTPAEQSDILTTIEDMLTQSNLDLDGLLNP